MKKLIIIAVVVLGFSSCKTLVPFTENLKEANSWKDTDIKQIQFYNSETIILHRQLNKNETGIVSGKIKVVDGKEVEEIIIKKGTPGIVIAQPLQKIAVSFEIGDDYYLTFGVDKNRGDRYYLRLKDYKKGEYALVTYKEKAYELSPASLSSYLTINLKKIDKQQRELRVAKGRKL